MMFVNVVVHIPNVAIEFFDTFSIEMAELVPISAYTLVSDGLDSSLGTRSSGSA